MDSEEVCLYVKFDGDFEFLSDGVWSWKFANGQEKGTSEPIVVPKNISFVELYGTLEEIFEVDSRSHELVLRYPCPISLCPEPMDPLVINNDRRVRCFISERSKTCLCVTLRRKDIEIDGGSSEITLDDKVEETPERRLDGNDGYNLDTNVDDIILDDNSVVPCDEYLLMSVGCDVSLVPCQSYEEGFEDANERLNVAIERHNDANEATFVNVVDNLIPNIMNVHEVSSVRIPEGEDLKVNQTFNSKLELIDKLQDLAMKYHFEFQTDKSNKAFLIVKCFANYCKWRLLAGRIGPKMFQVRKYEIPHSCSLCLHGKDHRNASARWIAKWIGKKYQDANRIYKPEDIINDFREEFGYEVSYTKAYNAQCFAKELLWGNSQECYAELPKFLYLLKASNPGTMTSIETHTVTCEKDGEQTQRIHFKYLFMALGQCIRGYKSSIRRVITVDGTFLKTRCKGTLLVAACQDGNYQIYPLAFGVVDSENNKSWTWFFEKLKKISGDTDDLVIISDRAESIKHEFNKVFKNARHGFCTLHLQKNLKTKFPNCGVQHIFRAAAEAYTVEDFTSCFTALCSKDDKISEYLAEAQRPYWARALFDGTRYNMTTSNNAESFNSRIKKAREFPVLGLLRFIREVLQDWFAERRALSQNCHTILTTRLEEEIVKRFNELTMVPAVKVITEDEYEVRVEELVYIVDLKAHTCTCRKFDLDKFPCAHAYAVTKKTGKNVYQYCSPFYSSTYWKLAYAESIYPLPNEVGFEFPEDILAMKIDAPVVKKKKKRMLLQRWSWKQGSWKQGSWNQKSL